MASYEAGDEFGTLRIEREIGRGGFGRVYLARDTLIDRPVALKVIPATDATADPEATHRVLTEARAVGRLNHPHIVVLYRVHPPEERGAWLFEMEYVEGGSLRDVLERAGALDLARTEAVFDQLVEALTAAHAAGIVHGDVKPGNVLLTPDGRVKLADFGLARLTGDASVSFEGGFRGTPQYAAPELAMEEPASPASDLWGLGVLLYRMLAGRLPFGSPDIPLLFHEIQNLAPPPLPVSVPDHLARVVDGLLAKEPGRRQLPGPAPGAGAAVAEGPAAAPAEPAAARPRLSGRRAESRRLAEWLRGRGDEAARALCLVRGEPGIGKTALGRWAAAEAGDTGRTPLVVQANALEGLVRPLMRTIRRRVERRARARPSAELETISAALGTLIEERPSTAWDHVDQARWAIEQALRELAREGPLLLVLEDGHLLAGEEVSLVLHLARYLPPEELRILVLARSGGEQEAALRALEVSDQVVALPLGPLAVEEGYELLLHVFDAIAIEPDLAQRLLPVAGGNPLHLVEMARHLREQGAVTLRQRVVVDAADGRAPDLPQRLRDLMALRLAALGDEERDLLDVAAALGDPFDAEPIAAVLDRRLIDVLRALQRLYRDRRLVRPATRGFRFESNLLREAVHAELAPHLRRELHRLLAEHCEALPESERPAAEWMAYHWSEAGRPERARPYWIEASRAAGRMQQLYRSLRFAERADWSAMAESDEFVRGHAEYLLVLTGSLNDVGRADEAIALLDRIAAVARAGGDHALETSARVRRHGLRYRAHGLEAAEIAELREAARMLPPGIDRGRASYTLSMLAKYAGQLDEAETHARAAYESFGAADLPHLQSSALNALAAIRNRRDAPEEAERLYTEAARLAIGQGQRMNAAISEVNRAMIAFERGETEGVAADLERSIRMLELEGAHSTANQARVLLADIRDARGDGAGARRVLDQAVELLRPDTHPRAAGSVLCHAARAALRGGRIAEACELVERARERTRHATALRQRVEVELVAAWIGLVTANEAEGRNRLLAARVEVEQADDGALRDEYAHSRAALVLLGLAPPGTALEGPESAEPEVEAARAWEAPEAERRDRLGRARAGLLASGRARGDARRAAWADWLALECARLDGDRDAQIRLARAVADRARDLGDTWLRLRALARLGDAGRAEGAALADDLRDALPPDRDADAFARVWRPGAPPS